MIMQQRSWSEGVRKKEITVCSWNPELEFFPILACIYHEIVGGKYVDRDGDAQFLRSWIVAMY